MLSPERVLDSRGQDKAIGQHLMQVVKRHVGVVDAVVENIHENQ